jgi:glyoxalase-like protein
MVNGATEPRVGVDHILIGVPDLDRAVDEVGKSLGVRPVPSGRHPRGTHNALVALGNHTYLELVALQPGVAGADAGMTELAALTRPTPIGWAVSAPSTAALADALAHTDLALDEPNPGSRTTPAGETLRWQTLGLTSEPQGAPFFIVWSPETAHPSTTSPAGCTLVDFEVATPDAHRLRALCSALSLPVRVRAATTVRYTVLLDCPTGRVTFRTPP